jgi:hypothetical protein
MTNGSFSFEIIEGSRKNSNEGNGRSLLPTDAIGIRGGDDATCVILSTTYFIIEKYGF